MAVIHDHQRGTRAKIVILMCGFLLPYHLTFFLETQEKNLKITQVVTTSHYLPWIVVIYPPGSSQKVIHVVKK
jgi:hypothetical protein